MCGQERVIDLTGLLDVHVSGQRKRKRQSAALDSSEAAANTVDLSRSDQDDEAGPSNYTPPAFTLEDEAHETAARSEVTRSTKGKQERSEAASAKQAEAKKQQLNAKKAEAKAERDAARLVKKARSCEQKRVNQLGNIVRYASNAPQKTKERMVRALPSMCACPPYPGQCKACGLFLLLTSELWLPVQILVTACSCLIATWFLP